MWPLASETHTRPCLSIRRRAAEAAAGRCLLASDLCGFLVGSMRDEPGLPRSVPHTEPSTGLGITA